MKCFGGRVAQQPVKRSYTDSKGSCYDEGGHRPPRHLGNHPGVTDSHSRVRRDSCQSCGGGYAPQIGTSYTRTLTDLSGTNPKDWKQPLWYGQAHNSGDDVAGYVETTGPNVFDYVKGDRVAGYHVVPQPHGAFAEYAIVQEHTTFRLPPEVSFEEVRLKDYQCFDTGTNGIIKGATIPLAALTSAFGLFYALGLPAIWANNALESHQRALIVYGSSSALGAYAIKLARAANIHPIIAIGGGSSEFVKPLLNETHGDAFIDYRQDQDHLLAAIQVAAIESGVPKGRLWYTFDAITNETSVELLAKAVASLHSQHDAETTSEKPKLAMVMLNRDNSAVDPSVDVVTTNVGLAHSGGLAEKTFSYIWNQLFSRGLREGWMTGHPYNIAPGGLYGLEKALRSMRAGEVRGKKMVIRIAETKGLGVGP
jgi:NADPH2:quinone reductase